MSETPADLLYAARKTVPEISAEEAKARLDRGEVDLIVDVREPLEWDAGHIPGALHAPRGMIEWLADPSYANHKPQLAGAREKSVVIQCASGRALAARGPVASAAGVQEHQLNGGRLQRLVGKGVAGREMKQPRVGGAIRSRSAEDVPLAQGRGRLRREDIGRREAPRP